MLLRSVGQLEGQAPLREAGAQPRELELDDLADLVAGQRLELDDLVDPVEELGPERLAHRSLVRHVRGHDQHRVPEVDRAALAVGQTPVVEHLEQDVEHLGMRFLDLVEQDDRVGRRRTASVSCPPSSKPT